MYTMLWTDRPDFMTKELLSQLKILNNVTRKTDNQYFMLGCSTDKQTDIATDQQNSGYPNRQTNQQTDF